MQRSPVLWSQRAAIVLTRVLLGVQFITAGAWKFSPVEEYRMGGRVDEFFTFMHGTGLWWQFIGVGQITAGILLLTQRFGTVGAMLLLPITTNILVINISLGPAFGATIYFSTLNFVLNLALVLQDYPKWKFLFWKHAPDASPPPDALAAAPRGSLGAAGLEVS